MILKIPFKITLLLLAIPLFVAANNPSTIKKSEKQRNIKKSFNVSSDATLKVHNAFGNINIITWEENKIEFDITIKVSGNNSEKVQERLNGIDVEFSSSSSMVSAITKIEKNTKNWWNWGKKANLKMEIDYVVKMPMTNNVDLKNKFGTIILDKLKGDSKIRCDHGKITAKELLSSNNTIKFNHTRDNYFDYIKNATITATHSGVTIAKVEALELNIQHTKSIIEIAENVEFKGAHGYLKIEEVNTIQGDAQHFTTRIGNLYKNADLNSQHGSLKIERVASKANNVVIDSQFTGVTIGYDAAFDFNFDLNLQFGSLRDADEFNFTNKEVKMHNKQYKGYYGSKGSGNNIKVKSQHGSVSFKQQ